MKDGPGKIRALVFDVFGTVVDWRCSIIREGELLGAAKGFRNQGLQVDWPAFADAWRAGYRPAMDRVGNGALGWTNIDALHRMMLDELLVKFSIKGLSEADIDHLNRAWHRLSPWPDTVGGLNRLRGRYVISSLSNGNVALLVNMAKNAGLPWDCVLSGEIFKAYKPDPRVYQGAAAMLGCANDEVMLVAAHPNDLEGARKAGLRTAYVHRALEFGAEKRKKPMAELNLDFDVLATDFLDLAAQLKA